MSNPHWTTDTFEPLEAEVAERINVGVRKYNDAHIPELQLALSRVQYGIEVYSEGADTSPAGGYPGSTGELNYHVLGVPLSACEVKLVAWYGLLADAGSAKSEGYGIFYALDPDTGTAQFLSDWFDLALQADIPLTADVAVPAGWQLTLATQVQNTKVAHGTGIIVAVPTSVPAA